MTSMYNTHISFSNIDKRFGHKQVLNGAELDIRSGVSTLLCGENGSGKTTLLNIIAGELTAQLTSSGRLDESDRLVALQLLQLQKYLSNRLQFLSE